MAALSLNDFKTMLDNITEIKIKEWENKTVYMKPLSAIKQLEIMVQEQELKNNPTERKNVGLIKKMLLQNVICDADGNLLFNDETIDILMNSNAKVVDQLFNEALDYNFPRPEQVEEIAKN